MNTTLTSIYILTLNPAIRQFSCMPDEGKINSVAGPLLLSCISPEQTTLGLMDPFRGDA